MRKDPAGHGAWAVGKRCFGWEEILTGVSAEQAAGLLSSQAGVVLQQDPGS